MAITTVEQVKRYLGITSSADDALLAELVAAANAFVLSYIGRDLERHDYIEKYNGTGSERLSLDNDPIVEISSLKINGRAISASTEYKYPGFLFDGTLVILRGDRFTRGYRNIEISYRAGYETVPADIVQAATYVASQMYKRKDRLGVSSKTIGQESITYDAADLDTKSKGILNQYKKRWLSR